MISSRRTLTRSLASWSRHCSEHLPHQHSTFTPRSATSRPALDFSRSLYAVHHPASYPQNSTRTSLSRDYPRGPLLRRLAVQKSIIKRHCSHRRAMFREDLSSAAVEGGREVLPDDFKPTHYDLTLEPDLQRFSYTGTIRIEYVRSREP